jgi:tripartite-type tricarboxylate transporter receptor subunit TctC
MKNEMTRRQYLGTLASGAGAALLSTHAQAADVWPSRPIKLTLGFPPGGNADALARLLANKLGASLGQTIIVENKGGATGTICSAYVAQSPPDGYTLQLAHVSSNVIGPLLLARGRFDPIKDFTPVGMIGTTTQLLTVNAKLEFKTVRDVINFAKANPGKLTYMSAGMGSSPHLAGESFCSTAGITMLHVPYKGTGEGMTSLIGGEVDMTFSSTGATIQHIQSGRLRALGVCSSTRLASLPALPTVAETLPGYDAFTWYGLAGPAKLPPVVLSTLAAALQAMLKQPDVVRRLEELDIEMQPGTPAEFEKFWAAEVAKYDKIIAKSNIKV